jgi:hypothetical protein
VARALFVAAVVLIYLGLLYLSIMALPEWIYEQCCVTGW